MDRELSFSYLWLAKKKLRQLLKNKNKNKNKK